MINMFRPPAVRISASVILFLLLPALLMAQAGKHGAKTVNSSITVNEYTILTADASSGSTSINVVSSSLNGSALFPGNLAPGDLLFIIQMQGAQIITNDDTTYGTVTNLGNCGNHEFVQVASVPSANTINLSCALSKSYTSTGKTQVIRVPRYSTLTVNATGVISCPAWNGVSGGVLAMEVQGNTLINSGGLIEVNGKGFRGGALLENASWWGVGNSATALPDYGSEKGEGVAGYQMDYDAMSGRYCKGAPANGGGGANAHNAGGGGGANAGLPSLWTGRGNPDLSNATWTSAWNLEYSGFASSTSSGGGKGGYTFSSSNQNALSTGPSNLDWGGDKRAEQGGRGGRPLSYSTGKIFAGGGGGSGDQNNNSGGAGGAGGGIIYLLAYGDVNGSGAIRANGNNGANSNGTDGAGGGGAGGAVLIPALGNITGITISANGGSGGSQNVALGTLEAEGPGGGGGGGYIAISNGSISRSAAGGQNGTTNSFSMTEFPPNGATRGGSGESSAVLPVFKINITSPQTVCGGQAATLSFTTTGTAPPGTNLGWYSSSVGGVLLASGNTYTTPPITGTTLLYVGSCPGVYRQPVLLNPSLLSSSFSASTVCQGTATQFNGSASSALGSITGWSWDFGDGAGTASVQSPSYTYASGGTYTVTLMVTDDLGCTSVTSNNVTVNPRPTISFNATPSWGCLPLPVQFTNSSTNAANFTWNFGDGSATSSQTSPVHVYTSTGNYSVTLTASSAAGCTNTQTQTNLIQSSPKPTAIFSASSLSVCPGDTVRFTDLSLSNGAVITSRVWDFDDGSVLSSQTNPAHAFMIAGTYQVKLTIASAVCAHDTTISIVVSPGPVAAFSSVSSSGCAPFNVSFINNTTGTPTYSWNFGDGSPLSSAASPVHTYTSSGTYTVTLIASQGTCSDTLSITDMLVVYPTPEASFDATSNICLGDTVDFLNTSSGSGGITGYSWDFGDGTPNSNLANPSHVYNVAGTYQVTLLCSTSQCTDDTVQTITVNPAPQVAFTVSAGSYCEPAEIVFTNTSTGNPQFSWDFGDGSPLSTVTNPSHTYTDTGTYPVTLIATTGSCSDTFTLVPPLLIYPVPAADFTFQPPCVNDQVQFNDQTQGAAISTYTWDFGDGSPVSGLASPVHSYSGSGNYTVQLIVISANNCRDTIEKTVTVEDKPQVSFIPDQTLGCDSLYVQFTNTGSGAVTYLWTFGDGGTSTQENPLYNYVNPGSYTVQLTAESATGCSATRSYSNLILVRASPVANFSTGATSICAGDCISFSDQSISGVTDWAWNFPGANPSTSTMSSPTSVCYPSIGIYDVSLIVSDGYCQDEVLYTDLIHVVDCSIAPTASFIVNDSSICGGGCLSFVSLSSNATGWSWSFPGSSSPVSVQEHPSNICYPVPGDYPVTLIASNASGSDSITVQNLIHVYPAPNQPLISQNGDTLSSSAATSYQWYLNGTVIQGATGRVFIALQSGNYTVQITDQNGCVSLSESRFVSLTGIEESFQSAYLYLYPVPCDDELQLLLYSSRSTDAEVSLFNMLGELVLRQEIRASQGENNFPIHLSSLAGGIYSVQVRAADFSFQRMIIKR